MNETESPLEEFFQDIFEGDLEAVRRQLEADSSRAQSTCDSTSPLMQAASAMAGSPEMIELLLAHGASAGARDDQANTALHWLSDLAPNWSAEDATRCVGLLVEGGAEVDARNDQQLTALMKAAALGEEGVFAALLAAGADHDVVYPAEADPEFAQGLDLCDLCFGEPGMLRALLERGWQPETGDLAEIDERIAEQVAELRGEVSEEEYAAEEELRRGVEEEMAESEEELAEGLAEALHEGWREEYANELYRAGREIVERLKESRVLLEGWLREHSEAD